MADVVGEPREVDEVGVAAQPDRHAPSDLRHLERMGQPGPWRLALPRTDDLGLVGQPAQGGTVQHPGAVAGEVGAVFGVGARQCGTLWRLGHQSLAVEVVVWVVAARIHRRIVCQDCSPVSGARGAMPVRLTVMRRRLGVARLLSLVLAVLTAGLVLVPTAPTAWADPPLRLADYVTDDANALSGGQRAQVQTAVDDLYSARRIRLWVVYVDSFSGQSAQTWAQNTMRISDFQDEDAILAVATGDRAYAFLVPQAAAGGVDVDSLRRNEVEPALRSGDWAGAAVAAAGGLNQNLVVERRDQLGWRGGHPRDHRHRGVGAAVVAATQAAQASRGGVRRRATGGSGGPQRARVGPHRHARRPVPVDRRRRRQRGAHQRQRIGAWRSRNSGRGTPHRSPLP